MTIDIKQSKISRFMYLLGRPYDLTLRIFSSMDLSR